MRMSDWSSDVCSSDLTRRIFGAGFLQGLLIAFHIRSADFFEFADRDMDEFGGLQHPGEAFRPQREILRRVLALLFKPVGQRPHGLRSRPSGLVKLLLQCRVLHLGKSGFGVAGEIVRQPRESRGSVIDIADRQGRLQIDANLIGRAGNVSCKGDERLHAGRRIGIGPRCDRWLNWPRHRVPVPLPWKKCRTTRPTSTASSTPRRSTSVVPRSVTWSRNPSRPMLPRTWPWWAAMYCPAESSSCSNRPRRAPAAKYSRSEEHTSELQSLMRNSYAVFCLQTKHLNYTINIQSK